MPFKMIANRHVYRDGKEYSKGESFTVETELEMSRLVRAKRASAVETKAAPVKPVKRQTVEAVQSPVVQKVLMPEEPAAAAADPAPAIENDQPEFSRPNRYRRSDMRSED